MQITIPDDLAADLVKLAAAQFPQSSRTQLTVAILRLAVRAWGDDNDAEAWRRRLEMKTSKQAGRPRLRE